MEKTPGLNLEFEQRLKCPKGMKLPKSVKTQAALGGFTNQADRNHYMRSQGIALHEANQKARSSQRDKGGARSTNGAVATE
jgi:hypothetical protein